MAVGRAQVQATAGASAAAIGGVLIGRLAGLGGWDVLGIVMVLPGAAMAVGIWMAVSATSLVGKEAAA